MDNSILPQVINLFNVYKDGVRQIGIANEVSLAEIAYKVVTIDGAGIAGSYEEAVIGNLILSSRPFRSVTYIQTWLTLLIPWRSRTLPCEALCR